MNRTTKSIKRARMADMRRVIETAIDLHGDRELALIWYHTSQLRHLSGRSPELVVRDGGADELIAYMRSLIVRAELLTAAPKTTP
jgi:uncharacterized protein (DUF2384 family)